MKRRDGTAWVMDAAYFNKCAKAINLIADMLKVKRLIEEKTTQNKLIRDSYYLNSVPPDHLADSVNRYHTFLKSAEPAGPQFKVELYGYKKLTHKCSSCNTTEHRLVQKGVDVAIAMRLVSLSEKYAQIILLAGDADFLDAVRYAKTKDDTRLVIAGFRGSVSADLQSYADQVIWLDDYVPRLRRDHRIA